MNEIQKENAKVAIEYWQKVFAGESPVVQARLNQGGRVLEWFPVGSEFQNSIFSSKNYESRIAPKPQEMVEHKGGSYPKPVVAEDIVGSKQYYIPDPLDIKYGRTHKMFSIASEMFGESQFIQSVGSMINLDRELVSKTFIKLVEGGDIAGIEYYRDSLIRNNALSDKDSRCINEIAGAGIEMVEGILLAHSVR